MPGIEDRFSAREAAFMFSNTLTVLAQDDPRGINLQLNRTANRSGLNAVFVSIKVDQAGSGHGDGLLSEPNERPLTGPKQGLLVLEHLVL